MKMLNVSNTETLNKLNMEDERNSIALARVLSDMLPMSGQQESDIERYYKMTHYPRVKTIISDMHDIVRIQHRFVEELTLNLYRLRNSYITPNQVPSSFWNNTLFIDQKTLDTISKESAFISNSCRLLTPIVLEITNFK